MWLAAYTGGRLTQLCLDYYNATLLWSKQSVNKRTVIENISKIESFERWVQCTRFVWFY